MEHSVSLRRHFQSGPAESTRILAGHHHLPARISTGDRTRQCVYREFVPNANKSARSTAYYGTMNDAQTQCHQV